MTILVDMDDTIEYLLEAWCNYLNKKHGTKVSQHDITEWNVCAFFPELTKEEVFEPLLDEEFWKTVRPRQDAIEYLKRLEDDGDEVYILTATDYRTIKPKFDYVIRRYFPWISWDNVIIASKKQMVAGDVLVDDGIHNLEGGHYTKILMNAPHNRSLHTNENVERAESWKDVYNIIQKIKQERYGNEDHQTQRRAC